MNDDAPGFWSRGGLQSLGACPACSGSGRSRTFERRDDCAAMPDSWCMHLCASCASIYLDPRPDGPSLPSAYDNYLTHEVHQPEAAFSRPGLPWALLRDYLHWRFGLRAGATAPVGRYLFSLVEPWRLKLDRFGRHLFRRRFPNGGRLLDVGCGNGEFLLLAKAMGWRAEGVEPDQKASAICRSRGLDVVQGGIEALHGVEAQYDAITLSHVIEHVTNPRKVLADCRRLLKPGGMLWLAYPNPQALGIRVFGSGWCALHPPFHLCLPSQPILRGWLKDAGFERISLARRGLHANAHFRDSPPIAQREGFNLPSRWIRSTVRIFDDAAATITPHWAEETIAIAWRPASAD